MYTAQLWSSVEDLISVHLSPSFENILEIRLRRGLNSIFNGFLKGCSLTALSHKLHGKCSQRSVLTLLFLLQLRRSEVSKYPPTLFTSGCYSGTFFYVCKQVKERHLFACLYCPPGSTTMLRVFPAWQWCNGHCSQAPCLHSHMSCLSNWKGSICTLVP